MKRAIHNYVICTNEQGYSMQLENVVAVHDVLNTEICYLKFCTKISCCYDSKTLVRRQIHEKLGIQ